jgi:hypothetical protein
MVHDDNLVKDESEIVEILEPTIILVPPKQILGPNEKGIKAIGFLLALVIPLMNLSGLNSCTLVPQNSGSW